MKTQVITICSLAHRDVWKLTSDLLPRFIRADEFLVFVPEDEVLEFTKLTNSIVKVRSQSELGVNYSAKLWERVTAADNSSRYGWYLQQFLKIEALLSSDADYLIIWDADCVPVNKIETFDISGRPIYMVGADEYHQSYFDLISKLLNLQRVQSFSFVIPGFPIPRTWVQEFADCIAFKNEGKAWSDAILDTVDFSLKSGFSETETLGTYVANYHPGEWSTFSGNWERRGQKRFGYARTFSAKKIVKVATDANLDIVSFENWDVRGIKLILRRLSEHLAVLKAKW